MRTPVLSKVYGTSGQNRTSPFVLFGSHRRPLDTLRYYRSLEPKDRLPDPAGDSGRLRHAVQCLEKFLDVSSVINELPIAGSIKTIILFMMIIVVDLSGNSRGFRGLLGGILTIPGPAHRWFSCCVAPLYRPIRYNGCSAATTSHSEACAAGFVALQAAQNSLSRPKSALSALEGCL